MLFDKLCSAEARTISGAFNNYVFVPVAGLVGVPINIQPMQAEFNNTSGMAYKNYKAYVSNSGIAEGMRLTVSGVAQKYIVRGRADYNYFMGQHYELILEADKS